MAAPNRLRLVLVTPERTILDEPVEALRFPLYDGQIGVLPGRAPLVGRLGYGELRITAAGETRSYYVDGGFVQVKGPVVSLLTNRALAPAEIDRGEAEEHLRESTSRVATGDYDMAARERDQERARRMLAMARRR